MNFNRDASEKKSFLRLFGSGLAMGAADVVPGVSGGTIAFILGVYEDLINAIHSIDISFFRKLFSFKLRQAFGTDSWRFLAALGSGIAVAILTLSRGLLWALEHYPEMVWAFFFGLVLASVLVVAKRVQQWTAGKFVIAVVAAVLAFLLFGAVPLETPTDAWFLFLTGAISICAMILPGISGAFVMLLLGKYQFTLEALVTGNLVPIIIMGLGAIVGIITFARFLRWLLTRYHDLTVAALIGLIVGALRKVWPWKEAMQVEGLTESQKHLVGEANVLPNAFTGEVAAAVGFMILGFVVVFLLEYFGSRKQAAAPEAATPEV
jgi:putative membrane protein